MNEIKIGVVGYCPPTKFDEVKAAQMIEEAYSKTQAAFPDRSVVIVSGLTNVGVLAIAYAEATSRRWRTVGIACKKAVEHRWYPVDESIIVGTNWGDESPTFLKSLDGIIRIGGGKQSYREVEVIKSLGKFVLEYDLPALN
ncbi:MAG: hypothetical protein PHG25_00730 [Candidatus Pacebacteria bacterium]|nr:hypothetical protein [Candidatus Paceibacterota bacterium]